MTTPGRKKSRNSWNNNTDSALGVGLGEELDSVETPEQVKRVRANLNVNKQQSEVAFFLYDDGKATLALFSHATGTCTYTTVCCTIHGRFVYYINSTVTAFFQHEYTMTPCVGMNHAFIDGVEDFHQCKQQGEKRIWYGVFTYAEVMIIDEKTSRGMRCYIAGDVAVRIGLCLFIVVARDISNSKMFSETLQHKSYNSTVSKLRNALYSGTTLDSSKYQ